MSDYDAEDFERRALAGDWMAAVSVLSRASLKPEVRVALLVPDAHDEVRIALLSRMDVTAAEIGWAAATTENTFILNRIVAHGRTSTNTIREIRDRSVDREPDTWTMLHSYAERVLERIAQETGLHGS